MRDHTETNEASALSVERCPKNPSMPKAYCSHCQGTSPGTANNPRFSLREGDYNGCPIVEVLKDGGPVHRYDSHFRFGTRKAQMLLACMDSLRAFWQATDEERLAFKPQLIEDKRNRLSVWTYVEMHPDFEHSTGEIIELPWLHLEALGPNSEHIGLGRTKCRAVCAVRDDLMNWLQRVGVRG